jgi:thiol-disulfide isomerase/thioredoxin
MSIVLATRRRGASHARSRTPGLPRLLGALAVGAILAASAAAADLDAEFRPAAAFTLKDLNGRIHRLADYKGKVLVLNFWATWCEPCREEMPSLDRLAAKFAGRPFAVLAVDYAEGEARVREFAARMPLGFPLLLDRDSNAARDWKVRVLPATFVIDANQKVRFSARGALEWDSPETVEAIGRLLPTLQSASR